MRISLCKVQRQYLITLIILTHFHAHECRFFSVVKAVTFKITIFNHLTLSMHKKGKHDKFLYSIFISQKHFDINYITKQDAPSYNATLIA